MSEEQIDLISKTAAELKRECKERGLKVSGTKAELVERIEEHMHENNGEETLDDELLADVEDEPVPETEELKDDEPVEEAAADEEEEQVKAPEAEVTADDAEAKKLSRAERFGIESKEVESSKKMSRAERFGLPEAEKAKVDEKKKKRGERFGTTLNGASGATKKTKLEGMDVGVDPDKLKKRMERFGVSEADEPDMKKKARAARFAAK